MAGIPINLASGADYWTRISFFVKFTSFPPSTRVMVDLDAGSVGNFQVIQNTDGHILAGGGYDGNSGFTDLTPAMALYTDKWHWVSAGMGCFSGDNFAFHLMGKVTGPGGLTDGVQSGRFATPHSVHDLVGARLGWGVSLTGFYAAWPKHIGDQMDSLAIDTSVGVAPAIDVVGPWPLPTGDIDPALATPGTLGNRFLSALYKCLEPAGTTAGLADSTGNHYDLLPGPQGMVVVADGPF